MRYTNSKPVAQHHEQQSTTNSSAQHHEQQWAATAAAVGRTVEVDMLRTTTARLGWAGVSNGRLHPAQLAQNPLDTSCTPAETKQSSQLRRNNGKSITVNL